MTKKNKKGILLVILLLAAAGGIIGYRMWNKAHVDVGDKKPAYTISAVELYNTFSTDSATAKTKFIGGQDNGKVIEVQGEVSEIKTNQANEGIILLKTNTGGAFINCTMEGKSDAVKAGDKVSVKGMCNGYNFDADMGIPGDVTMVRCYIIK